MSKSFSPTFKRAPTSVHRAQESRVELQDLDVPTPGAPPAKKRAVRPSTTFYTVEVAADVLSLDATALRARLRRAQRAEGNTSSQTSAAAFPASNCAKAGAFVSRSADVLRALSIAWRCAMLRSVTHEQAPMEGNPWKS
jgi:hypothetical protein